MGGVQALVAKWREEHKENDDEIHICCTVFGGERRISDCEKRRGNNATHYKYRNHKTGQVTYTPKAKFVSCVKCVVWKQLPPQEFQLQPYQGNGK